MKNSYIALYALAQAANVVAFPAMADALVQSQIQNQKRQGVPDPVTTFDAQAQYVSNTGVHTFQAPDLEGGDVRGPCPGLNAMANHGYLPHNGVGTHLDFISGTAAVFGMGADLAGFLTVLGAVLDGDGLSWSIGGPSSANSGLSLGGLLGTPQGISGSHNKYESDASPTRGDLYLNGNDFTLQMDQFQQLYDMGQANGDSYTLDVLNEFRSSRFDHSVQNNPYFFNGPFTGVLVAPAAFEFIYRFMSNKSSEYPAGYLNSDVLMSFFSVTKDSSGNLVHTPGYERIPDNWYKRAIGDEYTIPYLNSDTVAAALKYPKFLTIGGNTGSPNTLTGIAPEDLTGGVYNAQTLTQGNNLACFAMEFAVQAAPDLIECSSVLGSVTSAMSSLTSALGSAVAGLSCPTLQKIDQSQFDMFPGYSKLKCQSGTY